MKWYKCPICDGSGLVSRPPGFAGDCEQRTAPCSVFICNLCGGLGAIKEQEEDGYMRPADTVKQIRQTQKEIDEAIAHLEEGVKELKADIADLKQWRANLEARDA